MKLSKKELIQKIEEEMAKNYVRFSDLNTIIRDNCQKEWEEAVNEFYLEHKNDLTEFQKDYNIHCTLLKILKNGKNKKLENFKKLCEKKQLNYKDVLYNCGHRLAELKIYKNKVYAPWTTNYDLSSQTIKRKYKFNPEYEIILEDCI